MSDKPQQAPAAEPWLRGTLTDVPVFHRAVLHALQQAGEDVERWCTPLTESQWHSRLNGAPSVAFHVRHISGSIDRLLTYAEKRELTPEQLSVLKGEAAEDTRSSADILVEFRAALADADQRIRALIPANPDEFRGIGRKQLPTTLGGLLVHTAEHTQRHVGALIATARIVQAEG